MINDLPLITRINTHLSLWKFVQFEANSKSLAKLLYWGQRAKTSAFLNICFKKEIG